MKNSPPEAHPEGAFLEAKLNPSRARRRARWPSKRRKVDPECNLKIDVGLDLPWNRIFSKFGWFEEPNMGVFGRQGGQDLRTMLIIGQELIKTSIFLISFQ